MRKKATPRTVFFFNLIMTCAIVLLMVPFSHLHGLGFLNGKLYDTLFTIKRSVPEKRDNVVIVCVDQKSLDYYSEVQKMGWPWPRDFHAFLVRYLADCGAKAVIFDVIFSEPDIVRAGSGDTDVEFGESIGNSERTYLAASLQDSTIYLNPYDDTIFLPDSPHYRPLAIDNHETLNFPIYALSQGAAGIGLVNIDPESDSIVRRYNLVFKFRERFLPSLGMKIAHDHLGEEQLHKGLFERKGAGRIVDNEGKVLLNWYGHGDIDGVFTYYSYHGVLASWLLELQGREPLVPKSAFAGKYVIVGSNAPALGDMKSTPFSRKKSYPGMEIHATAIENGEHLFSVKVQYPAACYDSVF